jgi:hypothetical protein
MRLAFIINPWGEEWLRHVRLGGLNLDHGGILREQEAILDELLGVLNNLAHVVAMVWVELLQQILAEGRPAAEENAGRDRHAVRRDGDVQVGAAHAANGIAVLVEHVLVIGIELEAVGMRWGDAGAPALEVHRSGVKVVFVQKVDYNAGRLDAAIGRAWGRDPGHNDVCVGRKVRVDRSRVMRYARQFVEAVLIVGGVAIRSPVG